MTRRLSENPHLLRDPHPRPVEFSLRETAQPIQQGKSLRRTSMYASFHGICPCCAWTSHPLGGFPVSYALYLEIFHQPPTEPVLRRATGKEQAAFRSQTGGACRG